MGEWDRTAGPQAVGTQQRSRGERLQQRRELQAGLCRMEKVGGMGWDPPVETGDEGTGQGGKIAQERRGAPE